MWFVEIIWKLLEAKAILRLILLCLLLLFLQVVNKHFVKDLCFVRLCDQMLAVHPVLQLHSPIVKIIELILVGARKVQMSYLELMSVYLVVIFATHQANLHFGSFILGSTGLFFRFKIKVEWNDL